jgi:hypothetical protein
MEQRARHIAVTSDARAKVNFTLTNSGGEDLHLGVIRSSCDCTVASIEPNPIAPGAEGRIVVSVRPPASGHRTSSIKVQTNDPKTKELEVTITVAVDDETAPPANQLPQFLNGPLTVAFGILAPSKEPYALSFEVVTRESVGSLHALDGKVDCSNGFVCSGQMIEEVIEQG